MINSDEEFFTFFKAKIECAVSQLQKTGIRVSTYSYGVRLDQATQIWLYEGGSLHPLATFILNKKLLHDKNILHAISRRFNCSQHSIVAFNKGLSGGGHPVVSKINPILIKDLYNFGLKIRKSLAKKKV